MDSDLGDFFAQIPPTIFLIFCGSIVLLTVVAALIFWERRRKARRKAAQASAPAAAGSSAFTFNADLPELAALVSDVPAAGVPRGGGAASRLNLSSGEAVEAAEVMTVYRDVAEGGLIVQVGTSIYRSPPINADPEFRRRLLNTLNELGKPARESITTPAASAPVPAFPPADAPPMPPAPVLATSELPPMPPGALPGDLPKFRMPDKPEAPKRGRRRSPTEPIPEINIVEAIEAFLQYKLTSAPQFAGRGIHVKPAPGDVLAIEVDGRTFEAVSDIDDDAVRAYLQATIEEWQDRQ
ncbi:MAG: hypothetical protein IAE89_11270 [Anaerolineae bacterium]|nr:hypothetical protein [Anaerolineae bacterium]